MSKIETAADRIIKALEMWSNRKVIITLYPEAIFAANGAGKFLARIHGTFTREDAQKIGKLVYFADGHKFSVTIKADKAAR
jgi:hypothetical protein